MAPRSSWKGHIRLSLVSCPVKLYPATSSSDRISFNQLHKDTHNRINLKPVDPELGLVERSDLVKGYEYEPKQYVIIDDADLDTVRIESSHTINIEAFVEADAVDTIYVDSPYYLAPDGPMAEETFVVLREAMRSAGKVAIARLVLSSRERVVTIAPREKGMYVCTLRNPREVRGTAEYFDNIPVGKPEPEMLELAKMLIQQKLTKFEPQDYEDRYETALMEMIKQKLKGHSPIVASTPSRGNVINLMDALKASLGQTKPPAASKTKAPTKAKAVKEASATTAKIGAKGEEVSDGAGQTFGLIGALSAYSRRALARELFRKGSELQHRVTRRTTHVVFPHALLGRWIAERIEKECDRHAADGRQLLSENGFLRQLGLLTEPQGGTLSRQSLADQSQLTLQTLDLLALFDTFETAGEPFTFRDLILARKYGVLIDQGSSWVTIGRSVHRTASVAALTALSMQADGSDTIYARAGERLSELDGQTLLPLESAGDAELEELFAEAEQAEGARHYRQAAGLYAQCLVIDPSDAVAAFNQANCLRAASLSDDAQHSYLKAVKLDPKFVEAWFNLGCLAAGQGRKSTARRYFRRTIELDPSYADAVFNLASLEFDCDDLAEARRLWTRYLELDSSSDWARTAEKGLRYADQRLGSGAAR